MKTKVLVLATPEKFAVAKNAYDRLQSSEDYEPRLESFGSSVIETFLNFIRDYIPGLWGFLYFSNVITFLTRPLRMIMARFNHKNILRLLRNFQPAELICVGIIPSAVVAYLKSKRLYRGKSVIALSDYHLHNFSVFNPADLYLCVTEEQAHELKKLKVPPEKITITGMMIAEKFFDKVEREKAREKYNLLNTMPVVLLFGGEDVFLSLLRRPKAYQVVAVTGQDTKLKQKLAKISPPDPHPVKIFGELNDLTTLMSAADVLVGTMDELSVAQAVAKKLPMVLIDVDSGAGIANLEYLLRHKIVEYGRITREVVFLVEEYLSQNIRPNWEIAQEKIVKPKNSQSLLMALSDSGNGSNDLSVRNYQEN